MPTVWASKYQGGFPTCVAFALAACREFRDCPHEPPGHEPDPLSEQFLYWASKQIDGIAGSYGTRIEAAARVMNTRGICLGQLFPYTGRLEMMPSPEAVQNALMYATQAVYTDTVTLENVRMGIDIAGIVAASLKVFADPTAPPDDVMRTNWTTPWAFSKGIVKDPPRAWSQSSIGHAVAIYKYAPDRLAPGGGWFAFRNSWGTGWGRYPVFDGKRLKPGNGIVSAQYVQDHCYELAYLP